MNEKYNIEAIETKYNGYHFRSRLEARWAVFFDAIGLEYVYEYKDFVLPNKGRYLPDFYFPTLNLYVEVKPYVDNQWIDLCQEFAVNTKEMIILLDGVPTNKWYRVFDVLSFPSHKSDIVDNKDDVKGFSFVTIETITESFLMYSAYFNKEYIHCDDPYLFVGDYCFDNEHELIEKDEYYCPFLEECIEESINHKFNNDYE